MCMDRKSWQPLVSVTVAVDVLLVASHVVAADVVAVVTMAEVSEVGALVE